MNVEATRLPMSGWPVAWAKASLTISYIRWSKNSYKTILHDCMRTWPALSGQQSIMPAPASGPLRSSVRLRTRQLNDFAPQRVVLAYLLVELRRRARRGVHAERLQALQHVRGLQRAQDARIQCR